MQAVIFIFRQTRHVKIRAATEEFAQHVAESDDAIWDTGSIELIDRKDDDDAQA